MTVQPRIQEVGTVGELPSHLWTRVTFEGHCSGCGQPLTEEWVSKDSPAPTDRWVRCGRTSGCGTVTLLEQTDTQPATCSREGIAPPKPEGEA